MEDIYEAIIRLRREGRRCALATIVNVKGSAPSFESAKMLVTEERILLGSVGGGCVEAEVFQAAKEAIAEGTPRTLRFDLHENPRYDTGLICGGSLEIFVEPLLPVPVVYVFGAGHVGRAVYEVARLAGFEVIVADDREAFANRERFPAAREVHAAPIDEVLAKLAPPSWAFVVIVTRGHRDDMRVLRWAIDTPARYVGMLGSRRKVITIAKALEQEGVAPEKLARVYAPIGLDIGAVTPEEIGVAVAAELVAVRRGAAVTAPVLRRARAAAEPAAPARCEGL